MCAGCGFALVLVVVVVVVVAGRVTAILLLLLLLASLPASTGNATLEPVVAEPDTVNGFDCVVDASVGRFIGACFGQHTFLIRLLGAEVTLLLRVSAAVQVPDFDDVVM